MKENYVVGSVDPALADGGEPRRSPTNRPDFQTVAAARYARRDVLRGGLALAVASLFAPAALRSAVAGAPSTAAGGRLGFEPVPVSSADTLVVPEGYRTQVILPWGEPITGSHPEFALENSGAEQAMQMGMHHDGMHFFPIEGEHPGHGSSDDGLLVVNHEYMEPRLLHAAAQGMPLQAFDVPLKEDGSRDPDQVLKEINAHGVSVVHIRRGDDGDWSAIRCRRNRRLTPETPVTIGGPLAGDPRLRTPFSPDGTRARGTLNNCSHGVTPWNTYLACEENWWLYFNREGDDAPASIARYNVGRFNIWRWHLAAANAEQDADRYLRFDATPRGEDAGADYRNEPHTFGYAVEFDLFDPDSVPVKRTHLGRFSHEGVVFAPAREGRPVVLYSGDDSPFEYIYKFVSRRPYAAATADGSLLDEGTLYAARFDADGTGTWLALVPGENGLAPENGFATVADVLLNSRGAADIAGATPMDRPEWGAVDPDTGAVYFTLTNNKRRSAEQVDGPNPRPNNHFGQIVRWYEAADDHAATRFTWELFVLAGDEDDSRNLAGEPLTADNRFAMPDGLYFDPDRRLWIQTDIADADQNSGPYAPMGNNAMLCADPDTGEIRRFLTGPMGQEITGCVSTPDRTTLFINVQHPGSTTSAEDFAAGRSSSRWPDYGAGPPRSATVAITRIDGGKVGS